MLDPWWPNIGEYRLISYENLVNGRDTTNGEESDNFVWDGVMVVNTTYSFDTIPYYFNNFDLQGSEDIQ